jgi:hypothetical protein
VSDNLGKIDFLKKFSVIMPSLRRTKALHLARQPGLRGPAAGEELTDLINI